MSNRTLRGLLLAGCTGLLVAGAAVTANSADAIPDFMGNSTGWNSAGGMEAMPGPAPVVQDPKIKYTANNTGRQSDGTYEQPTWRYADLSNPNLTEFAKEGLRKANKMVDEGFSMYNRTSRCWQPGVPVLNLSPGRTYFIQRPDQVKIIWQRDQIVRTVRLNQQHSQNPKPSWNGESVGHYEGDTLVVDTVGQKVGPFSMIDWFGTPFTENFHVVERYRLLDYTATMEALAWDAKEHFHQPNPDNGSPADPNYKGKGLQIHLTFEDPGAFTMPWKATLTFRRPVAEQFESVCAENLEWFPGTQSQLPVAQRPDF